MKTASIVAGLLLLLVSPTVQAQQALECPNLPAGSRLHWEKQSQSDFIVCKGTTEDGRAVLNMMFSGRDPNLKLIRSLRAEKGQFNGESLYWHQLDLGGRDIPGLESRRITVVRFDKNSYAQIWIDAADAAELGTLQALTQNLRR